MVLSILQLLQCCTGVQYSVLIIKQGFFVFFLKLLPKHEEVEL